MKVFRSMYNVVKKMNLFTRFWDDQVKCPYLLGNSINTFVTYDDPESLRYKAQYVKDHDAMGIIIWEITGDYIETTPGSGVISGTPLLDTIHVVFNEAIQNEFEVNLKVYLEGAFNGSNMNTTLNSTLPMAHPFNPALPYFGNPLPDWNYTGTASVASIPNSGIVDWVLVELGDAANAGMATPATRIARQPAFLLSNGVVVGTDGMPDLKFSNSITHLLFVVIYHRNHLGVISANGLSQAGGVYAYNFSTGTGQAHGGASSQKQVGEGIWAMFGGDGNANGIIDQNDKVLEWQLEAGHAGIMPEDYNMDGQVNNQDKDDHWAQNLGNESVIPE
jgi:hypothetical protein